MKNNTENEINKEQTQYFAEKKMINKQYIDVVTVNDSSLLKSITYVAALNFYISRMLHLKVYSKQIKDCCSRRRFYEQFMGKNVFNDSLETEKGSPMQESRHGLIGGHKSPINHLLPGLSKFETFWDLTFF